MNRYLEKIAARLPGLKHAPGKLRELIEHEVIEESVHHIKEHRKKKHTKKADLHEEFKPDLTPEQMETLGVLIHRGSQYRDGDPKENFFGLSASLKEWPEEWHNENHPMGWYEWYQGYANGKRGPDDERQIKRWKSFKARMTGTLKKQDPTLSDLSVGPKIRQSLLNWGVAPGMDVGRALETGSVNRYLEKAAIALTLYECPVTQKRKWTVNGEDVPAGWVEVAKTYKKRNK